MRNRAADRLAEIQAYVRESGTAVIEEAHFAELRERLQPISDRRLQAVLRASGMALSPIVEGVRQDSFAQLERTLSRLAVEYGEAAGNRELTRKLRALVIRAKEHARFASRRVKSNDARGIKEEMAAWMLVWLENPAVFPQWASLRRAAMDAAYFSSIEST